MTTDRALDILAMSEQARWREGIEPEDENKAIETIREALRSKLSVDVLDKIKAEIKEWYWQADKQALAKDPCVVDSMIDLFIRTIDKYKERGVSEC